MAYLVGLEGALRGQRFPLKSPCLLGRGPYNHVVLDDVRISRQHSKISPEQGGHVVYDLNSVNGTFVNDVLVRRKKLEANDVLRVGPFAFRFEAGVEPEVTARVARPEFGEVLTHAGVEPPAQIIGALEASSVAVPGHQVGLNDLEDAYRRLRILYGFAQSIANTLDMGEVLDRIVQGLRDMFPAAGQAVVYLRDESGAMMPRMVWPAARTDDTGSLFALPAQLHGEVVVRGLAILSAPASGGMAMHAPIRWSDAVRGVLHVRATEGVARFTQGDLDLLTGVASQASLALQNARMHQESIKQQRLKQDLQLAEQIQKSFLPQQLPSVDGIEFITEYRPAYSVGGDFYDVFWQAPERLGVFIGDVSGKGVSAALLMARITSDLRIAARGESSPARALATVNRAVLERQQHDIFVTGIYLILDVRSREMVLANAGHPPPILRRRAGRAQAVEMVEGGVATAIGIDDRTSYEQVRLTLEPGDSLALYTDGILEATSAHGEQFGFERIERSIARGTGRAAELALQLLADVRRHLGEAPQNDDLTLIVCGISEPGAPRRPMRPTLVERR